MILKCFDCVSQYFNFTIQVKVTLHWATPIHYKLNSLKMRIIYLSSRVAENVSHLQDCPLMLSWGFWLFYLWVIILVSQMPCYAGTGCHCSKLMNNVTRDEVDIIISQADGGIFHTISSQLVKFGIINPANTLNKRNGILTFLSIK